MNKMQSLIPKFEEDLLDACLKLSQQDKADNHRFVEEALAIMERMDGPPHDPRMWNALLRLGNPIADRLNDGSSPKWSKRLSRLLPDPRFLPTSTHPDLAADSLEETAINPTYAAVWATMCVLMDESNLIDDYEAKRTIVIACTNLLSRLQDWTPPDEMLESLLSDVQAILHHFVFSNRHLLEYSHSNLLLLNSGPSSIMEKLNPSWKGSPGKLKTQDWIAIRKSDIPQLNEHFGQWTVNYHQASLFSGAGSEMDEIPPESISKYSSGDTGTFFAVTHVDHMSLTLDLCTFPELTPYEGGAVDEGFSVEEVTDWLISKICEQDGFIRISLLGHHWRKEKGHTLRAVLKPHGKTPNRLIQDICEETDRFFLTDREDAGGRIRTLKPDEDLSTLNLFEQSTSGSKEWLDGWSLPDGKTMAIGLVSASKDLSSHSTHQWDSLHPHRSGLHQAPSFGAPLSRFYRLIITQAINTEDWHRRRMEETDISPSGLLDNMIQAIRSSSNKLSDLNQEYIEDRLGKIRAGAEEGLARTDGGDSGPLWSWLSSAERDTTAELPFVRINHLEANIEWDNDRKEKQAKKERERIFGPVLNSPYLVSDYLFALRQEPESFEDFRTHVNENYRKRVRSSRTRILGHRKSDEQVWKVAQDGPSRSPEEMIQELLRRAGIPEKDSLDLIDKAKKVDNA